MREIAKQATQGEWVAFISPGKYGTYAVHTPGDNHHGDIVDWTGFDEQKNAENNARYIAAFNPVVVQALLDELEAKDKRIAELESLTVPQLPQQAVPDEMPEPDTARMFFTDAVVAIAKVQGWNACRAAMLHSAEPVSQAYKLNALDGNSPVTPDGWVMVPKELTPEMMRAVQIRSELGGYATSNLSGAYNMFSEFWNVAVSAAPKVDDL
ncbi:ead/Ea22-like family protein [Escherichia coli]|nr:ead/Ea22-like family protein [Escherichia coli]EJQ7941141.1 ead/Ea22-like family protein [Escherichia coli]